MQLSSIALAISASCGAIFSPTSLFANNEQGAWYDPSDLTTLFQDSAGTTPVTAVEQPVGLALDKRKGLVLGSELVTNGTFDTDTAWTKETGWSISGGTAVASGVNSFAAIYQSASVVVGRAYLVTFTVSNYSAGQVYAYAGSGGFGVARSANGTYTQYIFASGTAQIALRGTNGFTGSVDNISVRELPGNHAYQTTSASRPVLSARVNLLTKTEQFDDAAWTKLNTSVTANAITAPDGTTTADALIETTSTGVHRTGQSFTPPVIGSFTSSVIGKAGSRSWLAIQNDFGSNNTTQLFNLTTGVLGSQSGFGGTATITSLGNGWYRCTLTTVTSTLNGGACNIYVSSANNTNSYTGDGTSGIYIWGADLRVANTGVNLPAYQRVNTATDYATEGFPKYLKFDGVDDFLVTNSIDFSATDKMTVVGGYREFSNAAQVIAELSASTQANAGTFVFGAGSWVSGGNRLGGQVAGTSLLGYDSQANFAPPLTIVQSNAYNIGGTTILQEAGLRVNGEVQSPLASGGSGSAGSGNFGNYPLYIGRRGGTSMPFNGHLYGLIVRGAQTDAGGIANSERYMNTLTKAY